MSWFKRKMKPEPINANAVPRAPYEMQDSSEAIYRIERIIEIAGVLEMSLADTAKRLDKWVIHEASGAVGDEAVVPQFIPTPLWDDEWLLTRSSFPTREQAEAYINRVGGELVE